MDNIKLHVVFLAGLVDTVFIIDLCALKIVVVTMLNKPMSDVPWCLSNTSIHFSYAQLSV